MMKILIAGGGQAGLEAAVAARKTDEKCEIKILAAEALMPYRRPALSLFLRGNPVTDKSLYLKDGDFFRNNNISLMLNSRVSAAADHKVILQNGAEESFDRLIIATGATANIPALPGKVDNSKLYTMRSWEDFQRLDNRINAGLKKAIVIGGSVLGMEIADALLTRGTSVTVIEKNPRIFNGRLDEDKEREVMEHLHSIPGLEFLTGCNIRAVTAGGVELDCGREVAGEIIIFAAGCTPDVKFAESSGIVIGRGIVVDEYMRTSAADIFACGDAAQFNGRCFGLFNEAKLSGDAAGTNAAGGDKIFVPAIIPVRCYTLGLKLTI